MATKLRSDRCVLNNSSENFCDMFHNNFAYLQNASTCLKDRICSRGKSICDAFTLALFLLQVNPSLYISKTNLFREKGTQIVSDFNLTLKIQFWSGHPSLREPVKNVLADFAR